MYDNVGTAQPAVCTHARRACAAKKAAVHISDNCLSILSKITCYRTFKVTFALAFPTLIFTIRFPFFNAFTLIVIFPAFFVILFTLIFFPDTFTASVVTFFESFAVTLMTIFTVFPFFALILLLFPQFSLPDFSLLPAFCSELLHLGLHPVSHLELHLG